MDSKQLYIAADHLLSQVTWNDWIHFGTGNEVKHDMIHSLIDAVLVDEDLNLVHQRHNSVLINARDIKRVLSGLSGEESFYLWDQSLNKVIEFNRIGVLRTGVLHR